MIAQALEYLKRGWSVIPLGGNKAPLIKWAEFSKRLPTEAEVRGWWNKWPQANIGIATGWVSGLLVVDVDERSGVELARSLPATLMSKTGRGGVHMFYECADPKIGNYVRIRPGIDIRANGGQVVVAPSLHPNGNNYAWVDKNVSIAPLPQAVLDWCANPDKGSGIPLKDGVEAPRDSNPWESKIGEGSRNAEMTRRVGKLVQLGWPAEDIFIAAMAWNSRHCNPPLPPDELKSILVKILQRHTHSVDVFDAVSMDEMAERFGGEEIEWLIEGWLPVNTAGLVIAPPGTWKTWFLLDLAIAVSMGVPFLGQYPVTSTGPVLIIQQEDPFPLLIDRVSRILNLGEVTQHGDGWCIPVPATGTPIFWHTRRALRLGNNQAQALEGLTAKIKEIKPKLVIIDPLYSMVNLDDFGANGAQEMLALKSLRDEYDCSFMIAHHTKKSAGAGGRERDNLWGSQFLNAWLETGWQIRPTTNNEVVVNRHFKVGNQVPQLSATFDVTDNSYDVAISEVDEAEEPDIMIRVVAELKKGDIHSLRDLRDRLGMAGQGTVSRAAKKLGVVKNKQGFYVLPEEETKCDT